MEVTTFYYVTVSILLPSILSFFLLLPMFRRSKPDNQKWVGPRGSGQTGTDIIIVGAGVAGAALGYSLAKDGWRVRVIERDLSQLNRIAGELLHPGGYLKLVELGLQGMNYE